MNTEPLIPEITTLAAPDVETLLVKARAVFTDKDQERGIPEAPTQAGFLALARAGKEVWNAWRKAYPEPLPNFSGVDFRGDAAVDFSGFSFAGGVIKQGIISCVNFTGCKFGDEANFYGAQFGDQAWFEGAQFGDGAWFNGVQFGDWAWFDGAQFGDQAWFEGAQFGDWAWFDGAQFGDGASFEAWDVSCIQNFWKQQMSEESVQQHASYAEAQGLRSNAFHSISFRGARFLGNVSFQGRIFLSETDFGPTPDEMTVNTPDGKRVIPKGQRACFKGIPNFHGCTLHQNTSFDDAEFSAPPSAAAARAYRTLKLAFAQQHAIREEQRFFKLEMQAETGITEYPKRLLYQLYRHISDYGFSLIRPVGFWFAGLVLATFSYGYLAEASFSVTNIDWPLTLKLIKYSLLNTVPLPGLDKISGDLFSKDSGIQVALTVLEILHKTVSLVAFFLIGLALRNLFKMKG